MRQIDGIAEPFDHRAVLRHRSDQNQRHPARDVGPDDEAIRRAGDHALRRVAERFEGDGELRLVGREKRGGEEQQREETQPHGEGQR